MGIRQKLNEHPAVTTGVAIAAVVLALIFAIFSIHRNKPYLLKDSFFTDDDGKTYFEMSKTNVPPFDHNGKEAVVAYVFYCPHAGNFVAYMMKYPPGVKKGVEAAVAHGRPVTARGLVKRPGVNEGGDGRGWFDPLTSEGHDIRQNITCPDGGIEGMRVVFPN